MRKVVRRRATIERMDNGFRVKSTQLYDDDEGWFDEGLVDFICDGPESILLCGTSDGTYNADVHVNPEMCRMVAQGLLDLANYAEDVRKTCASCDHYDEPQCMECFRNPIYPGRPKNLKDLWEEKKHVETEAN